MKNVLFRILLVTVALPLLVLAALYLPHWNHALLTAIVLGFAVGARAELRSMFGQPQTGARALLSLAAAIVPGLGVWLAGLLLDLGSLELLAVGAILTAGLAGLAALPFAFPGSTQNLAAAYEDCKNDWFSLGYIGFPSAALVVILGSAQHSGWLILWFCMVVFANDSAAWFFGMTLGRHRGLISVSPNKSLEGFIAGLAGSTAAMLLGPSLFPFVPARYPLLLAGGLFCGASAIIGDLFESAIKRTAGVKDSGHLIPGRGGLLDSYDSLLFTALPFLVSLWALGITR